MTSIDDRLRQDLPELADALLDQSASSNSVTSDELDAALPPYERPGPARRRSRHGLVLASIVALGAAAAGVTLWGDRGPADQGAVVSPVPTVSLPDASPSTDPSAEPGSDEVSLAWEALPEAPIPAQVGAGVIWTGSEVIVAGGFHSEEGPDPETGEAGSSGIPPVPVHEERSNEAAAFNPENREWRRLPDTPMTLDRVKATAWTGTEAVVIGTVNVDGGLSSPGETTAFLLAYNPNSNTWRTSEVPADDAYVQQLSVAWTGERLVLWGHRAPGTSPLALAYDPSADEWDDIAPGPGFRELPGSVWTGSELIVVGGGRDDSGVASPGAIEPGLADAFGAAYDPARDMWRPLPPAPLPDLRGTSAVWTGEEVLVWGGSHLVWDGSHLESDPVSGAAYRPSTNTWRTLPDAPISGRTLHVFIWTSRGALVTDGTASYTATDLQDLGTAVYDPADDSWTVLDGPPGGDACMSSAVWTGEFVVLWGGSSGCGSQTEPSSRGFILRLPARG